MSRSVFISEASVSERKTNKHDLTRNILINTALKAVYK